MKFFFFVQMNIIVIYKLMLLFFMGVGEDAKSTQNNKYVVSVQISRKNWVMKLMLCMLINMKVFFKLYVSFLMD